MLASFFTAALLTASLPAHAGDWDWEEEDSFREWRPDTLNWASNIHPSDPSPLILIATTAPPPREMWCVEDDNPSPVDLNIFNALLSEWLHDYLDIPDNDPLPPGAMNIPEEC